jgi:hypothetical protein
MFDLDTIKKLNRPRAVAASQRRAVAMNRPKGHAKDAEKGRVMTIENADQIEAEEIARDNFDAHLKRASRTVAKWPAWKQRLLG